MIKNLCCCFCKKNSTILSLIVWALGKDWGGGERDLSKWNQRKIIEISYYVGKAILWSFS